MDGFKQTEIGWIPEDWEVKKIKEIASVTTGNKNTQDKVDTGIYPFFVRSQIVERINTYSFDGEGVLTAGDGVGTGKVFHYINGKFDYHQRVYLVYNFNGVNGRFFYKYFSNSFYHRIMQMTAKSSVDSVRKEMITEMNIPVPNSVEEQEAIAKALSDVDSLIDTLERKIAKKRNIKQGAMQRLLTGKQRLPGFSGDWVEKKLGDVCQIFGRIGFRGYTKADIVQRGMGAITLSPSDIVDNKVIYSNCTYISWKKYHESPEIMINNGDIIFVKTASIGKVALIQKLKEKATLNPQFVVFKNIKLNNILLFNLLINEEFKNQINTIIGGSTIPTMSQKLLESLIIFIPSTKAEQIAIAQILTDMDNEITTLEQKLDKYKQIKQGMMQELLTGRIRLVKPQ